MGWDNVYGERTPKEKAQDIISFHLGNLTDKTRQLFREELKLTIKELKENNLIDTLDYQEPIDEEKLDELAHTHCLNNGYCGCCEDEYIEDHSTTYGDVMSDIENAYKAGYRKAIEE